MWVVLEPSLVADGAFPQVRAGHNATAALVLEAPVVSGGPADPPDTTGAITPVPAMRPGMVSPRHRVTGRTVLRGKRVGVTAAGMFVLLDDSSPAPGRPFDAVGDLHLTTWLVPRSAHCEWRVHDIVLHSAPVPVLEQPPAPAAPPPSDTRLLTPQQYLGAVGAASARARGVWVRGGPPDYAFGEQSHVDQATVLGRDPVGTARRYLLNVELAPVS